MRERKRMILIGLVALLIALAAWLSRRSESPVIPPFDPDVPIDSTGTIPSPPELSTAAIPAPPPNKTTLPKKTTPTGGEPPAPPEIKLHKELIPKDITIVRCYYSREIATPGSSFQFDINGSGFTKEFEQMIAVESGHDHVTISGLKLVTANQIQGVMNVSADVKTGFVYPRVLIKNLPVFRAPDPFAVIRPGDVLNVIFIRMDDSGRAGRFRVFTNLTQDLYNQFRIVPSTPALTITDLEPRLPHLVEGTLRIEPGLPTGDYGLTLMTGDRKVFERPGMIRIVRPNVGLSGFIQGLSTVERFRRPGDPVDFYVLGSGFLPPDVNELKAKTTPFDMGASSFTYISPTQLRLNFTAPAKTPPGSYGVEIRGNDNNVLFQKNDVVQIVPDNWIAGVQVTPPVKPGGKSELRLLGRDLSAAFATSLTIELDEPGITLAPLRLMDPGTLVTEISVSSGVAPGDYWLQLKAGGRKVEPPYGSIIKVEPNP